MSEAVMDYRPLGRSDLRVSRIGFGCWAIGKHGWRDVSDEESIAAIHRALELGVNLFDTADVYGLGHAEELLSDALGPARNTVVIATKGGVAWDSAGRTRRDISPAALVAALDASLRRLRVDYIPLYQIHWPDGQTRIEDAVAALERCRDAGKIRWIGVCNASVQELETAARSPWLVATQFAYNLLDRAPESALLPHCAEREIAALTYSPLAQGLLSGTFDPAAVIPDNDVRQRSPYYQRDRFAQNLTVVTAMAKKAAAQGISLPQFALRWVLTQPGVTAALSGVRTVAQIEENVGALASELNLD